MFFTLYLVEFKTMMSRRQFFKLERHLWLHAFVWGRVSGYVFAFSLCLREKETDSPFVELHISRDRVPCESRERDPDRGARARRTGRVRCVNMVMARGKSLVPRPWQRGHCYQAEHSRQHMVVTSQVRSHVACYSPNVGQSSSEHSFFLYEDMSYKSWRMWHRVESSRVESRQVDFGLHI